MPVRKNADHAWKTSNKLKRHSFIAVDKTTKIAI